jgi:Mn-dependent DtxR family transcriptional regulator
MRQIELGGAVMGRRKTKELTPALEDYLKVIYEITLDEPVARVKDIANFLDVSLPSVTNAMKRLKELGFVNYEKYGLILLSDKGMRRAQSLERVHNVLEKFFVDLVGVPQEASNNLSCRMEHFFDEDSEQRTEKLIELLLDVKEKGEEACPELVKFLRNKKPEEE